MLQDETSGEEKNHVQKARKEKKRETDRIAQQTHRKRQKLQVQELQAQIELLTKQSSTEQIKNLLSENERLREEVRVLRNFFSTIDTQVQRHKNNINIVYTNLQVPEQQNFSNPSNTFDNQLISEFICEPQDEQIQQPEVCAAHDIFPINPSLEDNLLGVINNEHNLDESSMPLEGIQLPTPHLEVPQSIYQFEARGTSNSQSFQIQSIDPTLSLSTSILQLDSDESSFRNHSYKSYSTSNILTQLTGSDCSLTHSTTHDPNREDSTTSSIYQTDSNISLHVSGSETFRMNHKSPLISMDQGIDMSVTFSALHKANPKHSIFDMNNLLVDKVIRNARSIIASQHSQFDLPALSDVLTEEPKNMVLAEIKFWTKPMCQPRRNGTYLGISWVLYLIIHWHITKTNESFENLPCWLRPTKLQLDIPHPIIIDFIAWPKLRNELIYIAQNQPDSLFEVMFAIEQHSDFILEPAAAQQCTTEKAFCDAVSELKNWRIKKSFFNSYPHLEAAYKMSIESLQ